MATRSKRMRYTYADESHRLPRSLHHQQQPVYAWKRTWVTPSKSADDEAATVVASPYKLFKWTKTGQTVVHEDDDDELEQEQEQEKEITVTEEQETAPVPDDNNETAVVAEEGDPSTSGKENAALDGAIDSSRSGQETDNHRMPAADSPAPAATADSNPYPASEGAAAAPITATVAEANSGTTPSEDADVDMNLAPSNEQVSSADTAQPDEPLTDNQTPATTGGEQESAVAEDEQQQDTTAPANPAVESSGPTSAAPGAVDQQQQQQQQPTTDAADPMDTATSS